MHVIFEIQNEPVAWGPPYAATNATPPGALDMEVGRIQNHSRNTRQTRRCCSSLMRYWAILAELPLP